MSNEQRTILAIFLLGGITMVNMYFFAPQQQTVASNETSTVEEITPGPALPTLPPVQEPQTAETAAPAVNESAPTELESESEAAPEATAPTPPPVSSFTEVIQERVRTDLYEAVISNVGVELTSFTASNYELRLNDGLPIDLLAREAAPEYPGFLGLRFQDEALTEELETARFAPVHEHRDVHTPDEPLALAYRYSSPRGLTVEKQLTFLPDNYAVQLDVRFINDAGQPVFFGNPEVVFGNTFGLASDQLLDLNITEAGRYAHYGPLLLQAGSVEQESFNVSEPGETERFAFESDIAWAALDMPYFMAAVLPGEGGAASAVQYLQEDRRAYMFWPLQGRTLQAGESTSHAMRLYMGPKSIEALEQFGGGLDRAIDFGWFTFFGMYLFRLLKFFYEFVGNYGVSIILLTLTVRTLLLAFTFKSVKGMQKMQEVAPKIEKLRKEIKDPNELNMKIMEVYREEGVNPMMSCLPMLLQLPIFIALFNVLNKAIELRHAEFVLWITDLSVADPTYVLPIVMGLTAFVQQSFMPMGSMDSTQAAMMRYFMPIFFTAISFSFPAGLVVYWTTNNLFTILQQWAFRKLGITPAPATPSPQQKSSTTGKKGKRSSSKKKGGKK